MRRRFSFGHPMFAPSLYMLTGVIFCLIALGLSMSDIERIAIVAFLAGSLFVYRVSFREPRTVRFALGFVAVIVVSAFAIGFAVRQLGHKPSHAYMGMGGVAHIVVGLIVRQQLLRREG